MDDFELPSIELPKDFGARVQHHATLLQLRLQTDMLKELELRIDRAEEGSAFKTMLLESYYTIGKDVIETFLELQTEPK